MTTTDSRQTGADLLRGAAHLLRTPLGVIVGMSTTLRDYDERFSADQRRRYLGEISNAAEEMRVAIDGMSLLARLVSGSLTFAPVATPLERVCTLAAESLGGVWDSGVTVASCPSGSVVVDPQRLGQAFDSLARAVRPAEGVAITAQSGRAVEVRFGPVQLPADDITATLTRPLEGSDLSDWVARPGGWAMLAARLLIEGQGGSVRTENSDPAAAVAVSLRAAH